MVTVILNSHEVITQGKVSRWETKWVLSLRTAVALQCPRNTDEDGEARSEDR